MAETNRLTDHVDTLAILPMSILAQKISRSGIIIAAFLDSTETRELLNEFDAFVNHNSHDTKVLNN